MINLDWLEGWHIFYGLFMLFFACLLWFFVFKGTGYSLRKGDERYYVVSPEGNWTDETILPIAFAQWVYYNSIPYVMGIIAGTAFILYARIYPTL